jgi:hypothetical protein
MVQTTNAGQGKTAVIAGATGYIGKSVVQNPYVKGTIPLRWYEDASKVSSAEGKMLYGSFFEGAKIVDVMFVMRTN